jgi:hypothetical protein
VGQKIGGRGRKGYGDMAGRLAALPNQHQRWAATARGARYLLSPKNFVLAVISILVFVQLMFI